MRGLLALLLLAGVSAAQAAPYRIVGYVVDGPQAPSISPGKLDVVNFAFAQVDEAHHVFLPGATAPDNLRALTALRARQPSLRIVLSIGGWGAGHFSEAVADAQARKVFADSAIALLRQYDLDGLDIDWEYPTLPGPGISHAPADRRNFTLLLESLRQQLDAEGAATARHYLLTIAAAEGEFAQGLELARIAGSLDWINLMTYDFYGSLTPTTGHHAGLAPTAGAPAGARNAQAAVDEYLAAGVPADKIHLGVASTADASATWSPRATGCCRNSEAMVASSPGGRSPKARSRRRRGRGTGMRRPRHRGSGTRPPTSSSATTIRNRCRQRSITWNARAWAASCTGNTGRTAMKRCWTCSQAAGTAGADDQRASDSSTLRAGADASATQPLP